MDIRAAWCLELAQEEAVAAVVLAVLMVVQAILGLLPATVMLVVVLPAPSQPQVQVAVVVAVALQRFLMVLADLEPQELEVAAALVEFLAPPLTQQPAA